MSSEAWRQLSPLVQQSVCQPVRDSRGDDLKLRLGEPRLPRQPIEEKKQDKISPSR